MQLDPKFFVFTSRDSMLHASVVYEKSEWRELDRYDRNKYVVSGKGYAEILGSNNRNWYDVIRIDDGALMVSESIKNTFIKNQITGLEYGEIEITKIESRTLKKKKLPKYFWIRSTGSILVDEATYGLKDLPKNEEGKTVLTGWSPGRAIPLLETWSGSDFSHRNPFEGGYICTRAVIELIRQYQWSNILIFPIDCFLKKRHKAALDYTGEQWPPQWYPEGFEPDPRNLESPGS